MGFINFCTGLVALTAIHQASALPASSPTKLVRQTEEPLCYEQTPGILSPANGAIIQQNFTSSYDCINVTIVYCSGQYFKTSSIDTSVWLSSVGATSGELLAKAIKPDNQDAQAGFSSYRYNVTICPVDGTYFTGEKTISVYETETGYYNANNYEVHSINVTFAESPIRQG